MTYANTVYSLQLEKRRTSGSFLPGEIPTSSRSRRVNTNDTSRSGNQASRNFFLAFLPFFLGFLLLLSRPNLFYANKTKKSVRVFRTMELVQISFRRVPSSLFHPSLISCLKSNLLLSPFVVVIARKSLNLEKQIKLSPSVALRM